MTKSRYNPGRDKFSSYCTIPNCSEDIVVCKKILEDGKVCGQHGHPDIYKHNSKKIIAIVEHAHFLGDKDRGRNVFHNQGEPFVCPEDLKVKTWRLYRGFDRFLKIPKEVKENLGWY